GNGAAHEAVQNIGFGIVAPSGDREHWIGRECRRRRWWFRRRRDGRRRWWLGWCRDRRQRRWGERGRWWRRWFGRQCRNGWHWCNRRGNWRLGFHWNRISGCRLRKYRGWICQHRVRDRRQYRYRNYGFRLRRRR